MFGAVCTVVLLHRCGAKHSEKNAASHADVLGDGVRALAPEAHCGVVTRDVTVVAFAAQNMHPSLSDSPQSLRHSPALPCVVLVREHLALGVDVNAENLGIFAKVPLPHEKVAASIHFQKQC